MNKSLVVFCALLLGQPLLRAVEPSCNPASALPAPPSKGSSTPTPATLADVDKAMDLARRTLVFVEKTEARPAFAAELQNLARQVEQARAAQPADLSKLLADIRAMRRRLIFSHPLLAFDKLLINKNPSTTFSHNCDQYLGRRSRAGDGPTTLENWKSDPRQTVLFKGKLPDGAYMHPDLSYDGSKFLFAFADHTPKNADEWRFFLYEAAIDGSSVRQITGTPRDPFSTWQHRATVLIEDNDPCYLPDGGIAFVSSRSQNFGRCHDGRYTPSFLLFRTEADGSNIRQLSFGEANEVKPSVLPDGRIIYTRWEYVDRSETDFHKLWTTRPDGTAASNFYGNDSFYPKMIAEAQIIPGTRKVVATAMAHHTFTEGTVIVIDPDKGENGPAAITRITPEIRFPESNECGMNTGGAYASPYPLSEDLFLVAYSPLDVTSCGQAAPANTFGIYLIDTLGGREPIFRDPDFSCFSPIPVQPRPIPTSIPSVLPTDGNIPATGTYLIQNVYLTRNDPQGLIKPGQIKALRFNELINQPAAKRAATSIPVRNEVVKRILGTVPVNEDGSVAVTVPAGVPLQIQALDKDGMAVMTERTLTYLHPGEVRSCVGCHEPVGSAPPSSRSLTNCRPVALTPPLGLHGEGGLSFGRTVQPVLDRYCISCHGLNGKIEGKVNLVATRKLYPIIRNLPDRDIVVEHGVFSDSYAMLIPFTKTVGILENTNKLEENISRPMDYYAHGGKLGPMLQANHGKVQLDKESFARMVAWLDLNAQAYGDYSHNRADDRKVDPTGEKTLRDYLSARFGPEFALEPFPALVNMAEPRESRVLMAPLAVAAGGWGQIKKGGWESVSDPDYLKAAQLVEAAIVPLSFHDVDGTCGRPAEQCLCGSGWLQQLKESMPKK